MNYLVKGRVGRVPILHPETEQVLSVLTQLDLINYLSEHIESLSTIQRKNVVSELNLGSINVLVVNSLTKTKEVFVTMDLAKINGIPIIDENGSIVELFTSSDLKCLSVFQESNIGLLDLPILEFLKTIGAKNKMVECKEDSTLEELIHLMSKNRAHRVYTLDENKRPKRVISLQDVLVTTLTSMKTRDEYDNLSPQISKLINEALDDMLNKKEHYDDNISFLEMEILMDQTERYNVESEMKKFKVKRRVAVAQIVRKRLSLLSDVYKNYETEFFITNQKSSLKKLNIDLCDLWKGYFPLAEVILSRKMDEGGMMIGIFGSLHSGKTFTIGIISFILKLMTQYVILHFKLDEIYSTDKIEPLETKGKDISCIDFFFFEGNSIEALKSPNHFDYIIEFTLEYENVRDSKFYQYKKELEKEGKNLGKQDWNAYWKVKILPIIHELTGDEGKPNLIVKKNSSFKILNLVHKK